MDDLRDALMTHLQHRCNVGHRHAFPIGGPDRFVALLAKLLGLFLKLALALTVGRGKRFQLRLGLRRFSFRSCDLMIVKPIPANRFARTNPVGSGRGISERNWVFLPTPSTPATPLVRLKVILAPQKAPIFDSNPRRGEVGLAWLVEMSPS